MRFLSYFVLLVTVSISVQAATAQPMSISRDVTIKRIGSLTSNSPTRIEQNPTTGRLYYSTLSCEVYRLSPDDSTPDVLLYDHRDHGLGGEASGSVEDLECQGMDFGPHGNLFLVETKESPCGDKMCNVGTIRRGVLTGEGTERTWNTVAKTVPYLRSNSFDHDMDAIRISPDGEHLFLNVGSRSDHGEIHLGKRELPLTSAIFRLPTDTTDMTLKNDVEALEPYLFADGVRNHFDLAFAPNNDLFGIENSGDRNDSDELNWLRNGHHYGFPWRMGTHRTPQYYLSVAPDTSYHPKQDPLINSDSYAAGLGLFENDPNFPAPPDSVIFTDPVVSHGPDADNYQDPDTGTLYDASEHGTTISSFTAHRSPLGLVFDRDSLLAAPYAGGGFVLSYTDSALLDRMEDQGEDLLHLNLDKQGDHYEMTATRLVQGFDGPVDAAMKQGVIYVIEVGHNRGLWKVTLPTKTPVAETPSPPDKVVLRGNTPNPFSEATTIHYTLPRNEKVHLAVFDLLGRQVKVLLDNVHQSAGAHRVRFDPVSLPGGMYYYRLTTNAGRQTESMVLTR